MTKKKKSIISDQRFIVCYHCTVCNLLYYE